MDNQQSMQEKMAALGKKMDELKEKSKAAQTQSKKEVEEALSNAKGDMTAAGEQLRLQSEQSKARFSSDLIKAQMTFTAKKEEIQRAIAEKKYASAKEKAQKEADEAAEYAAFALDFACYAADEAGVAYLEALDKQLQYSEEYGDK